MRRIAAAGLAALTGISCVVALSGAAPPAARRPAPCGFAQPFKQAADGRVTGCLQVGPLAAGRYHVVVQALLPQPAPPVSRLPPLKRKVFAKVHEPEVALHVSPSGGPPGSWVTVSGTVARAVRRRTSDFPGFCWDGCDSGLQFSLTVHWHSSRTFSTRLRIPDAPWIRSNPDEVVPLTPASYPIGIDCVVSAPACSAGPDEASVPFELTGHGAPAWCPSAARCVALHLTPVKARPGDWVRVSGYAPLTAYTGAPVVLQRRARGNMVSFNRAQEWANIGSATLRVLRPPVWSSLRRRPALWAEQAGIPPFTISPADPSTVGYCSGGDAVVSGPGRTISFSVAGAASVLRGLGFAELGPVACTTATPIDSSVVAVFNVAPAREGGPPFDYVALSTPDRGAGWTAVRVPAGSAEGLFGGLRGGPGGELEAVFAPKVTLRAHEPSFPGPAGTPLAETTSDGVSWHQAPLACPASGPCLQFGAAAWARCAAIGSYQEMLRWAPDGRGWTSSPTVDWPNGCAQAAVVATGLRTALLVNSLSQFPLSETTDGGLHWVDVGVPTVHGHGYLQSTYGPGGLTLLPSRALLHGGDGGPWRLLSARTNRWCTVTGVPRALQALQQNGAATVAAGQLWWQVWTGAGAGPVTEHVPLSALTC
jgi:hypothetical protein